MRAQTHTRIQTHTHTRFSLFDDDEEEPLHLLILWPLKDKVFGSAVTELGQTVSRNATHFKQTRWTVQWPDIAS